MGAVRLRRRDGYFRTRDRHHDVIRFAGDRGVAHVDDGQGAHAAAGRFAQRGQAVRRFARLTYHDDESVLFENGIAIPEFGRQLHAHWNAGKILDDVLRRHARMISGAARGYIYPPDFAEYVVRQPRAGQIDGIAVQIRAQRIAHHARLFVYLLHHEMLVAAFLRGLGVPPDFGLLFAYLFAVYIIERYRAAFQPGDFQVAYIIHASGIFEYCGHVGSEIRLSAVYA